MQLEIRNMLPGDAPVINELSKQLGYPQSLEETKDCIREVLSTKDSIALVAITDGKVVGWIHGFKTVTVETTPYIEIGGLVVDEKHRGQDVGRELTEQIKSWTKSKGIRTIRVRSNIKRIDAHKFYSAIGFKEIKEQKVFEIMP